MNINQLEMFVSITETLNFSKTANRFLFPSRRCRVS